jgi:nitrogen regulatory protein PII 2
MALKEVIAIIRPNKSKQTKAALAAMGLPAFTAIRAAGRGRRQAIDNTPDTGDISTTSTSQGPHLFPKRLFSLIVPDDMVASVVRAIVKVNQTGAPGDGKIFVLPVAEAWRIRTREQGAEGLL